jgi:hypothetical protein
MKKCIFFIAILLFSIEFATAQDSDDPFIEISGTAYRAVEADYYYFEVNIQPGPTCEVPKKGKDWEKAIRDCREENEKLIASREAVLDALLGSFGTRIRSGFGTEVTMYQSGNYRYYSCVAYADFLELQKELNDVPGAFRITMKYASCSKKYDIESELVLEALQNARAKAEKMTAALGMRTGQAVRIYEDRPGGLMGDIKPLIQMMEEKGNMGQGKNMPNQEGKLVLSSSVFVRFEMKKG